MSYCCGSHQNFIYKWYFCTKSMDISIDTLYWQNIIKLQTVNFNKKVNCYTGLLFDNTLKHFKICLFVWYCKLILKVCIFLTKLFWCSAKFHTWWIPGNEVISFYKKSKSLYQNHWNAFTNNNVILLELSNIGNCFPLWASMVVMAPG